MVVRTAALICLLTVLVAEDAPVVIGKGSFAPKPPLEHKEIREQLQRRPLIEVESAGRPLPTNDWWTALLKGGFPERLYATPLIIGADGGGVNVWQPMGWNDAGTQMAEGTPLHIVGVDPDAGGADADIVIADFESTGWPAGWQCEGEAWAKGPVAVTEQEGKGVVGAHWAMSFANGGDRATGSATGPAFRIERDYAHLLVAGGKDGRSRIELLVDGVVERQAIGRDSRDLQAVAWDLRQWKGKQARLRLVDETGGGWGWIGVDQVTLSNRAEPSSGGVFRTCSTLRWGDWTVSMRLRADERRWIDATFGHGLPFVWIESQGLDLRVDGGGDHFTDVTGKALRLPATTDALVMQRDGRSFALYAPAKTRFDVSEGGLALRFAGKDRYVVVATLADAKQAAAVQKHAYAIPRDSRFEWQRDGAAGVVRTTWTVTTDALRPGADSVLQGWLPHHWRSGSTDIDFEAATFATTRGQLRLAAGKQFSFSWPFIGIVPTLPMPDANDTTFDRQRVAGWIDAVTSEYAKKPADHITGDGTYWGAKDLLKLTQMWTLAEDLGHPRATELRRMVRSELQDWFTWTPGETARYFAQYPAPWNALVGLKTEFGSGAFTDNHFHYGYHVLAAALFAQRDPQFARDFGAMATLVAKQFANWDRSDGNFPWLRTFDPWNGHSYAGGMSDSHDGNNQESSSEAMQSWAGVALLGAALGNDAMRDCGIMGYAIESAAIDEYWMDHAGWKDAAAANHPPQYKAKHALVSVLRDRDMGYWTWFSGKPRHVAGIQWIPTWPWIQYLARDPQFATWQVAQMVREEFPNRNDATILDIGDGWGELAGLGVIGCADPEQAVAIWDKAIAANHGFSKANQATIPYCLAHAYRVLGTIANNAHTDLATACVYRDASDHLTVVAWNPSAKSVPVNLYRDGSNVGRATVAAGALVRLAATQFSGR